MFLVSCDTEDWSNDAENTALNPGKKGYHTHTHTCIYIYIEWGKYII